MKQFIFILIAVVLLPVYAYSQTIIQTWTDPCTKVTSVFSIPIAGSTTIIIYNKLKDKMQLLYKKMIKSIIS